MNTKPVCISDLLVPRALTRLAVRGDLACAERNFDEAERLAPQGASKLSATVGRILISIQRGDLEKAKAEFKPLWSEYRHTHNGELGFLLARLGDEAEARALVAELSLDASTDPATIFWLYYGLKDHDHALEWLRRGIDDRNAGLLSSVRLPNAFPEIQDLPGFAAVLGHQDSLQRSPYPTSRIQRHRAARLIYIWTCVRQTLNEKIPTT